MGQLDDNPLSSTLDTNMNSVLRSVIVVIVVLARGCVAQAWVHS